METPSRCKYHGGVHRSPLFPFLLNSAVNLPGVVRFRKQFPAGQNLPPGEVSVQRGSLKAKKKVAEDAGIGYCHPCYFVLILFLNCILIDCDGVPWEKGVSEGRGSRAGLAQPRILVRQLSQAADKGGKAVVGAPWVVFHSLLIVFLIRNSITEQCTNIHL